MVKYVGPAPTDPDDLIPKSYVDARAIQLYANTAAVDAVVNSEIGVVLVPDVADYTGFTYFDDSGAHAVQGIVQTIREDYGAALDKLSQVLRVRVYTEFPTTFVRYRQANTGVWAAWTAWKWVPTSGAVAFLPSETNSNTAVTAFRPNTPDSEILATIRVDSSTAVFQDIPGYNSGARLSAGTPTASNDVTNKAYVDNRTPPILVIENGASVPGGTPAGTLIIEKSA